jgi:hypothetical protein
MRRMMIMAMIGLLTAPVAFGQTTRPTGGATVRASTRPSERSVNRRERRREGRNRNRVESFTPTTQPDDMAIPTPRPMAADYVTLTLRSIFFKGRFVAADEGYSQGTQASPQAREKVLVFDGVSKTDHSFLAYLEDTESGSVRTVKVGDAIAQGKITRITLDTMDYQAPRGVAHLSVGQNLAGEQIYGGSEEPTSMPSVDLSGPNGDILRKMMERRLKELGGH